jgi:hypothetical protein
MPGIEMDDSAAYGARYAHCVNIGRDFRFWQKEAKFIIFINECAAKMSTERIAGPTKNSTNGFCLSLEPADILEEIWVRDFVDIT